MGIRAKQKVKKKKKHVAEIMWQDLSHVGMPHDIDDSKPNIGKFMESSEQ